MNQNVSNTIAFVFGAAVGGTAVYYILKDKLETQAKEEIESVKEYYAKKKEKETPKIARVDPSGTYKTLINSLGYRENILTKDNYISNGKEEESETTPYPIRPDEFGTIGDYDKVSLVYYAGGEPGVLADENDEEIQFPEAFVGPDYKDHFGEYEDDVCYIRDDELKTDYEIIRDIRSYNEILNSKPWLQTKSDQYEGD